MTRDEAINIARLAGGTTAKRYGDVIGMEFTLDELERAFALVAQAEREACAKVCDGVEADRWDCYKGRGNHERFNTRRADPVVQGESDGASLCAAAIRARAVDQPTRESK